MKNLIIVLDNIRSAYNVGSALRTADCVGAKAVFTCGYTPDATHPKVKKTALGAEESVINEHFPSLKEAVEKLLSEKFTLYVMESFPNLKTIWSEEIPNKPTALIFGNEVSGVQLGVTDEYKIQQLQIPMFGSKGSLNVANAIAIAAYDITKRWRFSP